MIWSVLKHNSKTAQISLESRSHLPAYYDHYEILWDWEKKNARNNCQPLPAYFWLFPVLSIFLAICNILELEAAILTAFATFLNSNH